MQRGPVYSDIFGSERLPDTEGVDSGATQSGFIPDRVEDIKDLEKLLSESILEDLTVAERSRQLHYQPDPFHDQFLVESSAFTLSEKTHIPKVPDTVSLSSNDNTPISSPKKRTANNSTAFNPAFAPIDTSNNITTIDEIEPQMDRKSSNSTLSRKNLYQNTGSIPQRNDDTEVDIEMPNRSKGGSVPRRKPSLPQLALASLKKQASFGSSPTTTPTYSRRSPMQGFGFFNRSASRDLTDQHVAYQQQQQQQQHQQQQQQAQHSQQTMSSPQQGHSFRGFASKANPFSDNANTYGNHMHNAETDNSSMSTKHSFYGHLSSAHSSQTLSSLLGGTNNSGESASTTNKLNHAATTIGIGLNTRSSSTSLTSKRFTSSSGNSSHGHHHHRRQSSITPLSSNNKTSSSILSKTFNNGGSKSMATAGPTGHRRSTKKHNYVYPALLSRVATRFKKTISLGEYKKDGLVYRDAFTGQQAVDVLCSMIRSNDRNIAILLGRSLEAQKLFHDVVYEHRLRDSPFEVYEFTDNSRFIGSGSSGMVSLSNHDPLMLMSQGSSTTQTNDQHMQHNQRDIPVTNSRSSLFSQQTENSSDSMTYQPSSAFTSQSTITQVAPKGQQQLDPSMLHNVSGVFTLLAECYSPTCSHDKLCYSISCPKRLEQQQRLNLKPNGGLKRNISVALEEEEEEKQSWTSSVSKEIWKGLSKKEIKRQEAIYEVYITEKNFVKSLEVTRDVFMKNLAETNIIPADIRKNFIKHVFAHINDIYSVNRRFLEALSDRQKSSPVVKGIGDILLRFIPFFEPFVSYVASRPYAKYLIETQRSVNPHFARFDDDMMSSSLRHGIDSFLSQGVSRPGRYMLLVREILKSTEPEKGPEEFEVLTKAMDALRDFMKRIDKASGAAQDRHDVKLLKQKILFKNEYVNMGLNDEKRKIKHEGVLSRKELVKADNSVVGDIQFYLLDNMLLFLKAKSVNKWHQHKVFQRPIPLPLLFACPGEDMPILRRYIGSSPDSFATVIQPEYNSPNTKNAITFYYYGAKQRYQVTLYAAQMASLQTLLDKIKQEQQRIIDETSMINITKLSDKFFDYSNKVNSVSSCDGGRKLLIATNSGLYMSNIKRQEDKMTKKPLITFSSPLQLVQRSSILQVAVLDEFQSILLLVDKKLYSVPLSLISIDSNGTSYFKKHGKELVNHVTFFSEGDCNGKRLIVTAHSSSHSIKFFELEPPVLTNSGSSSNNKKSLKKKITEVVFDSEPVSISFLKANLCIGCKKGFQIVSISQNAHESLLDPADTSLEFALKDTLKPMAIYRVGNMFLLCYMEFAFFVNNQGWRKKESHIIHWEGEPQKFAIWYPYILAFNSRFIEIRKIDTGELVRCILGEKIRLLQTSTQEILYVYEDARGYDTVASLDFWG
ncbi:uncharacterized protein KNAG_0D04230 [Huiozyma naganishii CBS 8797]|uniref:DH domain-containing protein n=1 Tax=Huiozyma naganishii (strain ATCC MYA-139 / BCRC 22969 / CBS 8797 / KCTC 17520 / NBRC 10181 / NCYC 3082 / Yp74L-3) TaxID=1071383 RepID=J7S626_HUIN7|nr:hypothetical protein KNAG_0D04230 [Kazachstania naganishii CBS 8797]CCK70169.1 hypothetical protein KNAG_0D04230 [Kazachstania naganishii CBS 8797]